MFPTMTPIYTDLDLVSPTSACFPDRPSTTPAKRLRSCLSPTRTPTGSSTPCRPGSSRSTSFGSECSMADAWRRRKSVRWEGGESDDCRPVTSYFPTYSATEYDRTPLEPPSEAERTCVLPERGSRTFVTAYDCFDDSPHASSDVEDADCAEDDDDAEADDADGRIISSSPSEDITHESLFIATPFGSYSPCSRAGVVGGDDDEDDNDADREHQAGDEHDEDRQWEECMERRRMMFAMRCSKQEEYSDRQPEFEGYRSISAKLVEMLRSIEARRQPSPEGEDVDGESDAERDMIRGRRHVILEESDEEDDGEGEVDDARGRDRQRRTTLDHDDDGDDDEDSDLRPYSSFTFSKLQSLNIASPAARPRSLHDHDDRDDNDDIERDDAADHVLRDLEDKTETDTDFDGLEAATPSLISSAESELELSLVSPHASLATPPLSLGMDVPVLGLSSLKTEGGRGVESINGITA